MNLPPEPDPGFLVGTWTFTDPQVPLDTSLHVVRLQSDPPVAVVSDTAKAVYYGTVEPGGDTVLLLHNDIDRSGMSRHRLGPDGHLVEEGRWSSGGIGGSYITFDPTGRHFVVANAHTGWAVFENGPVPRLVASLHHSGSGPHPRQSKSHPHRAIFSPSGTWIYATDMGTDEVLAFPFDSSSSTVGPKVVAFRCEPGSGPRHVLAGHGLLYLLNELGNTLVVLQPQPDGTLIERQLLSTLPDGFSEFSHTAHLDLSRDGRHLYVSNRGHDSVMVVDVDADGLLANPRWTPSGGHWPWFFTFTSQGRMLVANNLSDIVAVFDIDGDGDLHPVHQVTVPRPVFVAEWPTRSSTSNP